MEQSDMLDEIEVVEKIIPEIKAKVKELETLIKSIPTKLQHPLILTVLEMVLDNVQLSQIEIVGSLESLKFKRMRDGLFKSELEAAQEVLQYRELKKLK